MLIFDGTYRGLTKVFMYLLRVLCNHFFVLSQPFNLILLFLYDDTLGKLDRHVSAISQSLRFILSLRLYSSFYILGAMLKYPAVLEV